MLPGRDNIFVTRVERELRRRHNGVLANCARCKKKIRLSDDYAQTVEGLMHADCADRARIAEVA